MESYIPGRRTLVLIKPCTMLRPYVTQEIIKRLGVEGFHPVSWQETIATKKLIASHYCHHQNKKVFFSWLLRYMTCGPILAIVFEDGTSDCVNHMRIFAGNSTTNASCTSQLRVDYYITKHVNCLHSSDSVEEAAREISLWNLPVDRARAEKCMREFYRRSFPNDSDIRVTHPRKMARKIKGVVNAIKLRRCMKKLPARIGLARNYTSDIRNLPPVIKYQEKLIDSLLEGNTPDAEPYVERLAQLIVEDIVLLETGPWDFLYGREIFFFGCFFITLMVLTYLSDDSKGEL